MDWVKPTRCNMPAMMGRSFANIEGYLNSLTPKLGQIKQPSVEDKALDAEKDRDNRPIEQFNEDDAKAGIDVVLLTSEGQHVNAKFILNMSMGRLGVVQQNDSWQESRIVDVLEVHDHLEPSSNIWLPHLIGSKAYQSIPHHDRKRIIVIIYRDEKCPMWTQKICLLTPDTAKQGNFTSMAKNLINRYKSDQQAAARACQASLSSSHPVLSWPMKAVPATEQDEETMTVASESELDIDDKKSRTLENVAEFLESEGLTDSWDQEEEEAPQMNRVRLEEVGLLVSCKVEKSVDVQKSNQSKGPVPRTIQTTQVWKSKDGFSGSLVLPSVDHQEIQVKIQHSKISGHYKVLVNGEISIDTADLPFQSSVGIHRVGLQKISVAVGIHNMDVYKNKEGTFEVFVDNIPFCALESGVTTVSEWSL